MRWACRLWIRLAALLGVVLAGCLAFTAPAAADQAAAPDTLTGQIVQLINQDRLSANLGALTVDPRLSDVAAQRAQYLIANHFFSHCTGGEDSTTCAQSGLDIVPRMLGAGIGVSVAGTTIGENLALNNYGAATPNTAAAQTNTAWLNSPEHRANIMDSAYTDTGVAVACCWSGTIGGTPIQASDQATIFVQVFAGGPGEQPVTATAGSTTTAAPAASCAFVLGFATIAKALPSQVGQCTDDESHNPANGDALQQSTGGLLVWRKADNWTAFTDGFHTWINGPNGVAERLNTQRFSWEANPDNLPVVS